MIKLRIEHSCDYCGGPAEGVQEVQLDSHWHPEYIIPRGGMVVGQYCACAGCFNVAMEALRAHRLATSQNLS